ncbi:MAG: hypothetical protein HUU21_22295 [Polyangiaceae bacterium]|nr:hypothetical protein [Polyangiaceae bacterium]
MTAIMDPERRCDVEVSTLGVRGEVHRSGISADAAIELVQASFTTKSRVLTWLSAKVSSGNWVAMRLRCCGDSYPPRYHSYGPLVADLWAPEQFYGQLVDVVFPDGKRSRLGEAAMMARQAQADVEDLLLRICIPDESNRVTTGCISLEGWYSPIELAGTYNADGNITRDVALSWLHIHDGDRVERVAGLSVDALAERVEAAPKGMRVGVSTTVKHLYEHVRRDLESANSRNDRPTHPGAVRRGARSIAPTDVELTREQVLGVLETPPSVLLEALETAAFPDDEWRDAEAIALEMVEAKKQGAPTLEVNVDTGHHRHFIEQHALYHVRRLPNGGVMLATHPYRTLWPLWADALDLLGIRKNE